ncbi:MAG TPA: DUF2780 domain-containing protein [Myxococcaceae bacterium]|jgi:hypothetical protein
MRSTHLPLLATLIALAGLAGTGCATAGLPSGITSNPLVSALTSGLGVSPEQAVGGTGAMMGLAQNKLSPDQLGSITSAVPGLGDITKAAGPLLGSTPLGSLTDVQGAFSKLGMSQDMVGKFAPVIGDAISKGGGSQVAGLFTNLFK